MNKNLTDEEHLAAGHKKCCYCGKWFEPDKPQLLVCTKCSAGDDNPFEHRSGRAYPRADIFRRKEEEY